MRDVSNRVEALDSTLSGAELSEACIRIEESKKYQLPLVKAHTSNIPLG